MSGGAQVLSLQALRDFRAALQTFAAEARDSLSNYDQELSRTLDWLLDGEPDRLKREIKRSEDAVHQAKLDLERCLTFKSMEGVRSACLEEKKALAKAKSRLEQAEHDYAAVKSAGITFRRAADEYSGTSTQLSGMIEADVPAALLVLDRAMAAVEAYLGMHAPVGDPFGTDSSATAVAAAVAAAESPAGATAAAEAGATNEALPDAAAGGLPAAANDSPAP